MARSVSAKKTAPTELGSETFSYVIRKMKPIFPIYVFAAIFELLIHVILRTNMPTHIQYRIWDLLFLRAAGLGNGNISAVGGGWYLSAMFLSCWICYPLLRKWPDVMMHIVAPLIAIFVFGWFEITHGHINFALTMQNGVCLGLLRGISEMCAGVFSYALCEKLKRITPEKPLVWITAAELIFMGIAFAIIILCKRSKMDYIAIVVLCIGIITSFSGRSYTNVWLQNVGDKLISWLAQFSLSLYLNHYVWINTLQNWKLAIPFWQEVIIFVVLSVLTAITCCVTVNVIQSLFQSRQGNGLRTEIPKQIKEQV